MFQHFNLHRNEADISRISITLRFHVTEKEFLNFEKLIYKHPIHIHLMYSFLIVIFELLMENKAYPSSYFLTNRTVIKNITKAKKSKT